MMHVNFCILTYILGMFNDKFIKMQKHGLKAGEG